MDGRSPGGSVWGFSPDRRSLRFGFPWAPRHSRPTCRWERRSLMDLNGGASLWDKTTAQMAAAAFWRAPPETTYTRMQDGELRGFGMPARILDTAASTRLQLSELWQQPPTTTTILGWGWIVL